MAQRGIRPKDAELIILIGTEVDDGYLVRENDYQDLEHAMKRWLENFRRVIGKRLIVSSGQIITAYHPTKRNQRKVIRDARASGRNI
jgi:hypothetical protein